MPTKHDLIAACTRQDGATNADVAHALGISSSEAGSRLAYGVNRGWLHKVHSNCNGGATRYFASLDTANEYMRGRVADRIRSDAKHSTPKAGQKVFFATPRGDGPWRTKCAPDRDVVSRPGALDFKAVPSLSPFSKGGAR